MLAKKKEMVAKTKKNTNIVKTPVIDKVKKSGSKTSKYDLLRGMHDILPADEKYWKSIYNTVTSLADHFLYGRIETPVVELSNLFIRSVGKGTDIVDKEMYLFEDNDGKKVCLRPEATASIARAYINHGLWNKPQPIKLWYWGQMFRHDRPQAGRYRQFFQVGFENLGALDPSVDAEMILLAYNILLKNSIETIVHVNSIGTPEERERYKADLVTYLRSKRSYLCDDCKTRINKNTLRVLDCKQEQCQPVIEEAPQILDWLGEVSKKHFMTVLEYLDELGVPYMLKPNLVRGLDYYNGLVFEFYGQAGEESAQSALGGGGRYDYLIESMGGQITPAIGFSLGVERVVNAMKKKEESGEKIIKEKLPDVYFAHLGVDARRVLLRIINEFYGSGIKISFNFFKESLKSQLESANKHKVPYVLILGQKEVQDGTVIVRDMESGEQEIIDQKKIVKFLAKKIEMINSDK